VPASGSVGALHCRQEETSSSLFVKGTGEEEHGGAAANILATPKLSHLDFDINAVRLPSILNGGYRPENNLGVPFGKIEAADEVELDESS
jgi:hypothetical protein